MRYFWLSIHRYALDNFFGYDNKGVDMTLCDNLMTELNEWCGGCEEAARDVTMYAFNSWRTLLLVFGNHISAVVPIVFRDLHCESLSKLLPPLLLYPRQTLWLLEKEIPLVSSPCYDVDWPSTKEHSCAMTISPPTRQRTSIILNVHCI